MPFGSFNSMLIYPTVVNVFIAVVIEELRERVVLTETGVHNGKRKFALHIVTLDVCVV